MIFYSPSIDRLECDLCIIGSGPAGIIVSLEYAKQNPDRLVILVEYGDLTSLKRNRLDDTIINHNPINHHDSYECTNKGLGGTTTSWGGRCVMYDDIDFIDRPILRNGCTWDKDLLTDVKVFTRRAADYFECGSGPFSLSEISALRDTRIAENFMEGEVMDSVIERWSMPTRFGRRYRDELVKASNIYVVTGAEARNFSAPNAKGVIRSIEIRDRQSGRTINIKANSFVVAAGAQESTRLLLRNPQVFSNLEDTPRTLGRFYQGHVSGKIASVRFYGSAQRTEFGFHRDSDGSYFRRRFQLSTDILCRENLLNTAIWLDNPLYHDPAHGNGAMSMMYLAMITPFIGRRLAPPAIANSITKGKINSVTGHLWNVFRGLPGSVLTPASIFIRRYCVKRKLPGVFLFNPSNRYALHFHSEQVPDSENRMVLNSDGETLEIHYRLTDDDITSVIRSHELLDRWLRSCGCGELEFWFSREELDSAIRSMSRDGLHQCGTTRISKHSNDGIVDKNLQVWGTRNLYVCSSSSFPTSGQANPTFFLGAFAVRLAHHLNTIYAKG